MKKLFLSALIATVPSISFATNLLSLYDTALQKDPQLRIADMDRRSKETILPQARGALLPSLDATASQFSGVKASSGSDKIVKTHGLNLQLNQAILNFNAWYLYKQAQRSVDATELGFVNAQQDLMVRLTQAYFGVLQAKDVLHFKSAQKHALETELEQVKQRLKVGLVAATDVSETQASFDNAVAEEIQAINDLESARLALQNITNEYPQNLAELQKNITLNLPVPSDAKVWIQKAKENNPNLQAAHKAVEAAEQGLKAARAANYPTINLAGGRDTTRIGTVNNPVGHYDNTWNTMLTVNVNLFRGGSMLARADQAYYDYQKAIDTLEKAERDTETNTSNAYRSVVTAISKARALNQAVLSSRTALRATQAAYEVGTRTSVDVLNSITTLYSNEQLYAEARHSYVVAQLLLKQAAGILSEEDLKQVNSLLTEKENIAPKGNDSNDSA